MAALREIFASYGVKFDTKPLEDGEKKTKKATKSLGDMDKIVQKATEAIKGFGGALVAGLTVGAFSNMITSTIQATNELSRWGQRLNTNVAEIAAWTRIAEPFGASVDDVTDAFKELQLKAQDAISGGTSQAEMFQRIGISLGDLRPVVNDVNQLMDLFVGRLNNVSDAGLRNFTVDELMSDAGTRMLPVFMQGSERLRELRGEMVEGAGATIKLAERMGQWNTTSARVTSSLENLKATVVLSILPGLERTAELTASVVRKFQGMVENSKLLEASMVTLTGVMVGVGVATAPIWGPMALTIAGVAAAILVTIGIVDDLWVTIEGGDSITRRFIDGMLGVGKTTQMVNNLKQAWVDLKTGLQEIERYISSSAIMQRLIGFLTMRSQRETIGSLASGDLFGAMRGLVGSDLVDNGGRLVDDIASGDVISGFGRFGQGMYGSHYQGRRERNFNQRSIAEQAAGMVSRRQRDEADFLALVPESAPDYRRNVDITRQRGESDFDFENRFLSEQFVSESQRANAMSDQGMTIDNRTTIHITGDGDPRTTVRMVEEAVRRENERQLRQTMAALVPGAP